MKKPFLIMAVGIIEYIQAKEYIFVVHADYKAMKDIGKLRNFKLPSKITKCIAVSQLAANKFKEATGYDCDFSYNPFELETPKKVLNLISATRLTIEKGKGRMEKLADALTQANIPFLWTVFTTDTKAIDNPNVIYMKPRLDILDYIANADYLVQLSDNEGYCYSVIEALTAGVPVLITPCPVFEELKIKNKEHGYILPFDMKNIPLQEIYTDIPKVTYTPPQDRWTELLAHGQSNYLELRNKQYKVRANMNYIKYNLKDSTLNRIPNVGEEWFVNYDRLQILLGQNKRKICFVNIVDTD